MPQAGNDFRSYDDTFFEYLQYWTIDNLNWSTRDGEIKVETDLGNLFITSGEWAYQPYSGNSVGFPNFCRQGCDELLYYLQRCDRGEFNVR